MVTISLESAFFTIILANTIIRFVLQYKYNFQFIYKEKHMKELTVKNIQNIEAEVNEQNGNKFTVKHVIAPDSMHIDFVEVEPNCFAYGYHWHEVDEEAFYIISGEASVRTAKGELNLKQGDIITFPTGEQGAHVIKNTSKTEKLIYLDFGRNEKAEIVHFPDINKIMAIGPYSNGIY